MNPYSLKDIVALALMEDLGPGDLTSKLTVAPETPGRARIAAREVLVLSGLEAAREVMAQVDARLKFTPRAADGDRLAAGDEIALIEGPAVSILSAERAALNFMMRLSGVATLTRRFVDELDGPARIVDTRKTTPGLRLLEKAAVRHGGGFNHRFALYDGVLIKDNHIAAAGSITTALGRARRGAPHTLKLEIEVDSLDQLREALAAGADIVLLDNMPPAVLTEAAAIAEAHFAPAPRRVLLEASGGVNLATVKAISRTGVDFISVGALTHSPPAPDLGLDFL